MSAENTVPAIRFEGFSGEWEECSLSKFVSSLDAGISVNSGDRPAGESEFGILKTSCVTNGVFEQYENKVVFRSEEINRLKEPVSENTIIISRMNTPALVGANAYIGKSYPNYFLPDRLWAAKPSSTGDLKFIAYILGSDKGRAALSELATGTSGSMKNIAKPAVFDLKFQVPIDEEQTKISHYFQQLDTLIAQHQKKHDKLLNLKKALLEKMFSRQDATKPEIRFKGFKEEWFQEKLLNIAPLQRGFDLPKSAMKIGTYPVVMSNGINGYHIKFKAKAPGIVTGRSGTIGNIHYIEDDYWPHNTALWVTNCKGNLPRFIYYLYIKLNLKRFGTGSGVPTLNRNDVHEQYISLPKETEEQTKISQLFKNLDTLIAQHRAQLKKLRNIKQACLDKMFV